MIKTGGGSDETKRLREAERRRKKSKMQSVRSIITRTRKA